MSNGLSCHAEFNTSISKWILKTRRNLVPYFCWKVLVTQWKTKQDTFCMVPRNILHSKYSNNKSLAPRFSHIMYAYYKAVTTCASCTDEHKKKTMRNSFMYTFKSWFYELGVVQVNFVRGRNRIGLGLWELQVTKIVR